VEAGCPPSTRSATAAEAFADRSYEADGRLTPRTQPDALGEDEDLATARVLRRLHGDDLKVVFIGPCIAKKVEAQCDELAGEVDAVLMFPEVRRMCLDEGIFPEGVPASDFDPPHGGAGGLFPVSRGILQAAGLQEDLMTGDVIATQGRSHMLEAIKEFAEAMAKGEAKLSDMPNLNVVFRLHPPRKGHAGLKRTFQQGGALGNYGEDISKLVEKMR